jgi:esterase/lipase superfamily enzyme
VHGFNNHFEDAVFRFAQFVHDSGAEEVVPILFTCPSRGSLFAYGYDHESASYSRDALEEGLRVLAKNPEVREITVVAHSMGNWVTLAALRQMAIRNGKVAEKIRNVILAAPDVDVNVASEHHRDGGTEAAIHFVRVGRRSGACRFAEDLGRAETRRHRSRPETIRKRACK